MNMFAKALEIIPRTIADNAGMDSLDLINRLRTRHRKIRFIQTKADKKICTKASILILELAIIKKLLSGSPYSSR